ncbi:MAG: tetratricopeptide repeat protein [Bacteroidota bacterium]
MNWLRYSGRIILALGVVAIALWATREKLIDIPTYQFWLGILCYLVAAEVVWTLVEHASARGDSRTTNAGLLKLPPRHSAAISSDWFHGGGRIRMDDIAAQNDILRDAHPALLASVQTRETSPRLHLLCGESGSGRSTMLLRLGRTLADQQQTVFLVGGELEVGELPLIMTAARKAQVYVLVDDLDLRPQAEDWLYQVLRTPLPIVAVATVQESSKSSSQQEGLDILPPAGLLSAATVHLPTINANDLASLARKLSATDRQQIAHRVLEETPSLIEVRRRLQGRDATANLWQELDTAPDLPLGQKIMLALCGVAELALPRRIATALLGEKTLVRWQRAALVVPERGAILPPHREVCLSLLETLEGRGEAIAALRQIVETTAPTEPGFALRLLFGLANTTQTALVARQLVAEKVLEPQPKWPEELQHGWQRLLHACELPVAPASAGEKHPPELSRLASLAYDQQDYERAFEICRQLEESRVYRAAAQFNKALILCRQERWEEARKQLQDVGDSPSGTHFLRGLIAEAMGDDLAALEAYETSRRADQQQFPSTLRLAFCRIRTGSPRAAIPLFEAVLAHAPLLADVYGGLAVAHLQAGMGQRSAVQSVRAIQAGVDPLAAHKAVAHACSEHYAFDRAAAELEACVNYEPGDLQSWQDLATACRLLGRFRREEECLRRVQLVAPDDVETRFQMARCERDQGRAEEAMALLGPLLVADPTVPMLLLAAETCGGLGDKEQQPRYATEALARGDESGWGHYWLADALREDGVARRTSYEAAIEAFRHKLNEGVPPRRAARLWQAVYQAAQHNGDEALGAQASRKARQEAAVCAALGVEIESVTHHRSVPVEVFLEGLDAVAPAAAEQPPAPRAASATHDR